MSHLTPFIDYFTPCPYVSHISVLIHLTFFYLCLINIPLSVLNQRVSLPLGQLFFVSSVPAFSEGYLWFPVFWFLLIYSRRVLLRLCLTPTGLFAWSPTHYPCTVLSASKDHSFNPDFYLQSRAIESYPLLLLQPFKLSQKKDLAVP